MFNRRSMLYFAGPLGEIRLGREWSPTYETFTAKFDPLTLGSGVGVHYIASINPNGVRVSNAVAYLTPRFAGLSANVQHWFGENPGGTPTSDDGKGQGIRLYYDRGQFSAATAYARTEYAAGNAIYRNIAAVYDFSIVRISGVYVSNRRGALKEQGGLIGALIPIGSGDIRATYSTLRRELEGYPKTSKLALGYVHNLSKRTAWYTTVVRVHNSKGSAHSIGASTTAADRPSTAFDLGIRHNF